LKVIDVNTGLFYKTIRKIVRRSLPHLGLVAYGNTITWPQREGYKDTSQAIAREGIAGIPADRCFTLFRIAQSLRSVPGDVFEAGCLFGKSSRFIMSGLGGKSTKQLHVFDSFEGLSEPAKEDNVVGRAGGSAWSAGELAADERVFLGNLKAMRIGSTYTAAGFRKGLQICQMNPVLPLPISMSTFISRRLIVLNLFMIGFRRKVLSCATITGSSNVQAQDRHSMNSLLTVAKT
jgi:hypothetical protein